jgi:hypothetical protein
MAPNSGISCVSQSIRLQRIPSECSPDLAPTAGLALIAGALSLWWNPKLRMKIDGMPGKFGGLAEYYQAQLIVMVARCVFWAVVKDPSASGLEPKLISAFHALMMGFTILVSMSFSLDIPGAKLTMVVGSFLSICCQLLQSSTCQLVRQQLGDSIRKPQSVFFCTVGVTCVDSHHTIWRNTKDEHWWITAALSD